MPNQMEINKDLIISDTNKTLSDIATYKDVYSTNEFKTNMVWEDGKPIYRKILTKGVSSNGEVLIGYPSNLDTLISFDAYAIDSQGGLMPAPAVEISYTSGNSYGSVKAIGKNSSWEPNKFYFVGFKQYVSVRIIVLYTKTTD